MDVIGLAVMDHLEGAGDGALVFAAQHGLAGLSESSMKNGCELAQPGKLDCICPVHRVDRCLSTGKRPAASMAWPESKSCSGSRALCAPPGYCWRRVTSWAGSRTILRGSQGGRITTAATTSSRDDQNQRKIWVTGR